MRWTQKRHRQVGYLELEAGGHVDWEFGLDSGLMSIIAKSDAGVVALNSTDLWWSHNWNDSDVWRSSTTGMGAYTLNLLGFEHCRGGSMSLRYDHGQGWKTATAIPEPVTVALLALGLFGLGLSRREKKASSE